MSQDRPSQTRHNPPPKYQHWYALLSYLSPTRETGPLQVCGGHLSLPNQSDSSGSSSAAEYGVALLSFANKFQWIYNRPVVAFLEEDMVSKFPVGWVEALSADSVSLSNLLSLIDSFDGYEAWPSSLKEFLEGCRELTMPREPREMSFGLSTAVASREASISELDPVLCLGMKPKKIHEVKHLSNMVHELCGDISSIVDVGSGKGYIAQALSHHFGYQVIGLEGSENQHEKAAQRFEKTELRRLPKKDRTASTASIASADTSEPARLHSTVNCRLEYSMESTELDSLIASRLATKSDEICLMSLHACGDLSPCILELFTKWDRAQVLVNVACCYHKIETSSMAREKGFPMSDLVRSSHTMDPPHFLWLELATQSPLQWQAMDAVQVELRLNKLFFRCLLEILFRQTLGDEASSYVLHIQKMKSESVYQSLESYLTAALGRSKIKATNPSLSTSQVEKLWKDSHDRILTNSSKLEKQYEHQRRAMKAWLALQSCFASVAESLVILDRWLYLTESSEMISQAAEGTLVATSSTTPNTLESSLTQSTSHIPPRRFFSFIPWIVPVFDQGESPRNLALIAVKQPVLLNTNDSYTPSNE